MFYSGRRYAVRDSSRRIQHEKHQVHRNDHCGTFFSRCQHCRAYYFNSSVGLTRASRYLFTQDTTLRDPPTSCYTAICSLRRHPRQAPVSKGRLQTVRGRDSKMRRWDALQHLILFVSRWRNQLGALDLAQIVLLHEKLDRDTHLLESISRRMAPGRISKPDQQSQSRRYLFAWGESLLVEEESHMRSQTSNLEASILNCGIKWWDRVC
jgi:hypothetical protein